MIAKNRSKSMGKMEDTNLMVGALGYERLITNGIPRFEPIFGGMHP
jgi:hypothetical protein